VKLLEIRSSMNIPGGVTLSGGEPTAQYGLLYQFLRGVNSLAFIRLSIPVVMLRGLNGRVVEIYGSCPL